MIHLPSTEIKPFERLRVSDGLLINAERWQREHFYHRSRQNFHYQSLNQPGIVWGLGIHLIQAPEEVPEQYWDGRWIQIQPGLAIDAAGNPIVVPETMNFRISSTSINGQPVTVYVVLQYVDPDQLQGQLVSDIVRETYRIDEKNSPPDAMEVELCRLVLSADIEQIEAASNVFAPDRNQLDLRYRVQAKARPQTLVNIATIDHPEPLTSQLSSLLQSIQGLYPVLGTSGEVGTVHLQSLPEVFPYDLLAMTDQQVRSLSDTHLATLHEFQTLGGVVLIQVDIQGTQLEKLLYFRHQLDQEIIELMHQNLYQKASIINELADLKKPLEAELASIQQALQIETETFTQPFKSVLPNDQVGFQSWEHFSHAHPLRTQPFLFADLPTIQHQPVQILHQGGAIMLLGSLSSAWAIGGALRLTRETIRTAEELGINLLHFAQRRKHLTQLQQTAAATL